VFGCGGGAGKDDVGLGEWEGGGETKDERAKEAGKDGRGLQEEMISSTPLVWDVTDAREYSHIPRCGCRRQALRRA
jgi:hypothetical protein